MDMFLHHCFLLLFITNIYCELDVITNQTALVDRGACISNPCIHNGLCTITPSGFVCTCVNGYIGVRCERKADDCPRDLAMDCVKGICKLNSQGHPRCVCEEGYEGPACLRLIDNCASKPCLNSGICKDKINGFECLCPSNTYGKHCQIISKDVEKCLANCNGYLYQGKCWHNNNETVTVGWGYGDLICNSKQICFNTTYDREYEYIEVQLNPIQMQKTDDLLFITDRDAILYDYHFVPHILPMEASSKESFISCNTTNAIPLTTDPDISRLNVNSSLLKIGTQYFIADMNALHRCVFGLRLNVTVKDKDCTDPTDQSRNDCNGHGKCFTDFNKMSYACLCCDGFIGKYCKQEDPCFIQPCGNNGKCELKDYGGGIIKHQCNCINGYHGTRCKQLINFCTSDPCQNSGACYPEANSYRCQCKTGFSGRNCEVNNNECATVPCRNGGKCHDGLNSFRCECQPGYRGTLCEVNNNECASQPCINGTCLDLLNNFTCACMAGQSGRICEIKLDECVSQPCIHGKCVNESNGFSCSCGIGYTGMLCELKVDLCLHSHFCIIKNVKSCVDRGTNVTCDCADGWGGNNCGINIDDCLSNKCRNGGLCVDQLNSYECKCKQKYTGLYCEVAPPKATPDIIVEFMTDDCQKFQNPQVIQHLEQSIVALLHSACKCSFNLQSLKVGSTAVECKDNMAGRFTSDLASEDVELQKKVLCGMANMIRTDNTPNIYHNTYLVSVVDNDHWCSLKKENNITAKAADSTITGVVVGVLVGFIVLIATLVFISMKVRNSRRKVGAIHKFKRKTSAFDNAAYHKDPADESLDETSFMSNDSLDCPKWAQGYDRARKLYERNRAVPAGKLFDFLKSEGESTKI